MVPGTAFQVILFRWKNLHASFYCFHSWGKVEACVAVALSLHSVWPVHHIDKDQWFWLPGGMIAWCGGMTFSFEFLFVCCFYVLPNLLQGDTANYCKEKCDSLLEKDVSCILYCGFTRFGFFCLLGYLNCGVFLSQDLFDLNLHN